MWRDSIKAAYRRNRRLIQGSFVAGGTSMFLVSIGYALATTLTMLDGLERVLLSLLIGLIVSILFGCWTARSTPRYPQTPLEYHQEQVEREILKEWGKAINWLRETTAAAEECSEEVIQIHRRNIEDGTRNSLREITLVRMHNKVCDLARAVADLCQRGHAEAAFMLWRSIFEIEINMIFIAQDETGERAERFLDWGRAAYLRLNSPNSDELKILEKKYPHPQQLNREIGWTRALNPMGIPARARAIRYPNGNKDGRTPVLKMYEESNAYGHNDAIAIANDLGSNRPLDKGPSAAGHDMPLCLTSRSVTVANDTLINSQKESDIAEQERGANVVRVRNSQVPLEVAMVPWRLLSRFRGFDMTIEWPMEGGGTIVAIPLRRESTRKDMERELRNRHKQTKQEAQQNEPPAGNHS